jgi:membrane-bound inhibitor of C-type lysozyme
MNALSVIAAALAVSSIASPGLAEPAKQPPMNDFYEAFYICESGAFLVSYDSDTPESATLTTSNNNKKFVLKRTPAPSGAQFSGGAVKFWTDGKAVTVEGAALPFKNCKMKGR